MSTGVPREIPCNYTSADDERVVRFLMGPDGPATIERLRAQRVTGRSFRLVMRFLGDLFMVRRNPYLYRELATSRPRRRGFVRRAAADLDTVETYANRNPHVLEAVARCRGLLRDLGRELDRAASRQSKVHAVLGQTIGGGNVRFDPFDLVSHATDATDWRLHLPLAVAYPPEEKDVAPLLAAIGRLGLHAIPRGAATGLTGGAVPVAPDCVMVNTEKLNRIRGVREVEVPAGPDAAPRAIRCLEVEAGVITEDAIRYAEARHLVFATDPTSAWASTIGGNIAENAGGKTAVLWGTAIDNLLWYRIALPDGGVLEVRRAWHPMRKILPGDAVRWEVTDGEGRPVRTIDLRGDEIRRRGLWKDITNKALGGLPGLQKEGTDGVVTSAGFVLHDNYDYKATFCLEFFGPDMQEASRVILSLAEAFPDRGEETLMALEHFDEEYVAAIDYRVKASRGGKPRAVLLVDMVGRTPAQLERGRQRLEDLLAPHGNTSLFAARDAAEAERFWQDRKRMGAIARRTNAFKLNEDIVLPLAALAGFAGYIDDYNLAEERHNHRQIVDRLRALVEAIDPSRDPYVASKVPRAIDLLDRALAKADESSKAELREGVVLGRLQEGLAGLFAGYGDVLTSLQEAVREVRGRVIVLATHMHAGDGNVHVNIPVFSNDREMMLRAAATADAVMHKAVELGGVVSGEHGIGITKLRHLEPAQAAALAAHRRAVDPGGVMNPGKLSDPSVPDLVFTPSFNLLELEARILKHDSLEVLADRISRCVRCGKCKADCCTFHPARNVFFHPRNKNLAIGAVIEALLYHAQRSHSSRFESLRDLQEVADHCTICHKCLKPCPVEIDSGDVSILERRILRARKFKHTGIPTRMTLYYLRSNGRVFNAVFRRAVLGWGTAVQRFAARVVSDPSAEPKPAAGPIARLLQSPIPPAAASPLTASLPRCGASEALIVRPEGTPTGTVFYFPGCGSERIHSDVARAAIHLALRVGRQVVLPPPYLCCGFPHGANARDIQQGRQVLEDTIVFSQLREMLGYVAFEACLVTCGTCREALSHMGLPGIFGCGIQDASRFALTNGLPATGGGSVLYHAPCHDSLDGGAVRLLADGAGCEATAVPHCCSEAGTLSLSRPDITANMLHRKAVALREALAARPAAEDVRVLTNCPSCLQGLGRNARLGIRPVHLAVELAERTDGPGWKDAVQRRLDEAEIVAF